MNLSASAVSYDHLKELEWLVGKWQDQDEDVDIHFNTYWDKFKNLIHQEYIMEVYGLEEFEGMQIIWWDPAEKKIRSWIYDSDGGFGSGVWNKVGLSCPSQRDLSYLPNNVCMNLD